MLNFISNFKMQIKTMVHLFTRQISKDEIFWYPVVTECWETGTLNAVGMNESFLLRSHFDNIYPKLHAHTHWANNFTSKDLGYKCTCKSTLNYVYRNVHDRISWNNRISLHHECKYPLTGKWLNRSCSVYLFYGILCSSKKNLCAEMERY